MKAALKDRAETRYCLKMDVRKFYHSMDPEVLKTILRRKIKDYRMLALMDEIIDSFSPGVPIGNYLSQFFANLYLAGFDHFMKEDQRCRYYFRYCDDVVILGSDKAWLHELRRVTEQYWQGVLKVDLKKNWQVFPVAARGIDFLGYRFFHDYTLLRKSIVQKFKRKVDRVKRFSRFMTPVAVVTDIREKRKKRFGDFADTPEILDGEKTRIDDILNREIEIIGSRIAPSKYTKNASGMCLTLQFIDPSDGSRRVVFTGSDVLIEQVRKYAAEMPFVATVKKINRYYVMT